MESEIFSGLYNEAYKNILENLKKANKYKDKEDFLKAKERINEFDHELCWFYDGLKAFEILEKRNFPVNYYLTEIDGLIEMLNTLELKINRLNKTWI